MTTYLIEDEKVGAVAPSAAVFGSTKRSAN